MSVKKTRKLAVAILGGHSTTTSAVTIAGAYIDLLHASQAYFAQSLPYAEDAQALAAQENLRALLPPLEATSPRTAVGHLTTGDSASAA